MEKIDIGVSVGDKDKSRQYFPILFAEINIVGFFKLMTFSLPGIWKCKSEYTKNEGTGGKSQTKVGHLEGCLNTIL